MKKNTFISIAICLLLLFSVPINTFAKEVKGNGKLITKSIPISNFSKIEIETNVVVDYSQGKSKGTLEFTIDNNLLEYYDIYTHNDVLRIQLKDEYRNKLQPKPTKNLLVISSEQLESIAIAGSSKVNFCTGFTSEKLYIAVAGSGKVIANKYPVDIKDCKIEIAGSGNVQFSGAIQSAHIAIAGSGSMNALDCEIAQLQAEIAGSGRLEAHVTDILDASVAGSGQVRYKGNPNKIKPSVAGSGKVKKI
ncbi:MAG: DUF2807 domain-containing protein [Lentimicrobiaceae bacterium]|nr:DUF2807 domain-containing protein [Lentimicrobiaceae bacterium]